MMNNQNEFLRPNIDRVIVVGVKELLEGTVTVKVGQQSSSPLAMSASSTTELSMN